jgi:hypothetical protein
MSHGMQSSALLFPPQMSIAADRPRPARATFYGANGVGIDGVSSFFSSQQAPTFLHPLYGPHSGEYGKQRAGA